MPTTEAMKDIIANIMVELLAIFGIAMKEVKRKRASEFAPDSTQIITDKDSGIYFRRLSSRTDIEEALGRVDRLTQDVKMATAQALKVVKGRVEIVGDKIKDV